jgi:hypothetical protein
MNPEFYATLAITLLGWAFVFGGGWWTLRQHGKELAALRHEMKDGHAESERRVQAALDKLDQLRERVDARHRRMLVAMAMIAPSLNPHGEKLLDMVREMSEDSESR